VVEPPEDMMKKWKARIILALMGMFAVSILTCLATENDVLMQNDPIHPANYARIHHGMNRQCVEDILGKERIYGCLAGYVSPNSWWGSSYYIALEFDNNDRVKAKSIRLQRFRERRIIDPVIEHLINLL
jgi:hypothetical protein